MKLSDVKAEMIRDHGVPYYEKRARIDKGGNNWNVCPSCGQWAQGVCKPCQSTGKLVKPLGQNAFKDLL